MRPKKSIRFSVTAKFLLIVFILSSLFIVTIPIGLQNFYIEETYQMIEQLQEGPLDLESNDRPIDPRSVNHMLVVYDSVNKTIDYQIVRFRYLDEKFLQSVSEAINVFETGKERYVYTSDKETIFYVIKKIDDDHPINDYYLVSFVYLTYIQHFVRQLFYRLILVILLIMILTLIISIFFANSIAKPLVSISRRIKTISENNWEEAIPKTRDDEIGLIEEALEEMRLQVKKQNKIQQDMFQNISHDLKTPIMIIQGYCQSILDGYVGEEELHNTVFSILEEAGRLEKKVNALLYINKLDQKYKEKKRYNYVDVEKLFTQLLEPFKMRFQDLEFKLTLRTIAPLPGEFDEWRVAIENIIDNMTRFAKTVIAVTYDEHEITIYNDGQPIDAKLIETIFEPYSVGDRANFGLGLAITKKIVNHFGFDITAYNEPEGGVTFKIYPSNTEMAS
ncbi:MAG TPA: HAMP domain-containing sensor histidine kinase [Haloplasmataceae bacterium]